MQVRVQGICEVVLVVIGLKLMSEEHTDKIIEFPLTKQVQMQY